MLYTHRDEPFLTKELFENPGSEFRGAPFWAWNADLEKIDLKEQMQCFKDMGLGGYHMHVRTGLRTKYMGKAFMNAIMECVEWSKANDMKAYLYDEDRWPSGTCGGEVTADREFCGRCMRLTSGELPVNCDRKLLAVFDVELDAEGSLESYRIVDNAAEAVHDVWYAYCEVTGRSDRYNGNPYVNTLSVKAIERFCELTHERYKNALGEHFGTTAPSIFTDEPQFTRKQQLRFAKEKRDVVLPWSDDLPETYNADCGLELIPAIPELIWELKGGRISAARYHYHDHVAERFAHAFADTCGKWCSENGIMLTGHMMEEPTLRSQTCALGDTMRSYRGFHIPGIDMLCQNFELTTAKQCQSAVHQYGREGMLSELYGVTGWHYSFPGYKILGDWQACLGVTLRVPHLSWMSMGGEAKRDYPATIFYQSPWYKEYASLETHYARLNTALTRGKPVVRVAVVHPVESYWLHWGPVEQTAAIREQLETRFKNVTDWLLQGAVDFDFISEALLPSQCGSGSAPLKVGLMSYDTLIVPGCETLRSSTLERLEAFRAQGGRLIFMGDEPKYENALPSDRGAELYQASEHITFERSALLDAVKTDRLLSIWDLDTGSMTDDLLYQLRDDNGCLWLMIARGKLDSNPDVSTEKKLKIVVKGSYTVEKWDTMSGEVSTADCSTDGSETTVTASVWNADSLLLKLIPAKEASVSANKPLPKCGEALCVPELVDYALDEPNVLLLDRAEYRLDDEETWNGREEVLRICQDIRRRLGWPVSTDIQPYAYKEMPYEHRATLRFTIECLTQATNLHICTELADKCEMKIDGKRADISADGWYVDKCISTIPIPDFDAGTHTVELTYEIIPATSLEWVYLTGNFGVKLQGCKAFICELPGKLGFSSITEQGLPFYGGNIEYRIPVSAADVSVRCPHWRGTALKACTDGGGYANITYAPYEHEFTGKDDAQVITVKLFGNRANSFGPVHLADLNEQWFGPGCWRTKGDKWTDSYRLHEIGLISAPVIKKL